jgi:cytochrome P450
MSDYAKDPLGFMTRSLEWGDIVRLRFGPRAVAFINHPDLIEQVLVTQNKSFSKHEGIRRGRLLLGDGLLLSEGDFWRRQRRLAQPAFHRDRLATYSQVMVEQTDRMLATWRDGERRDVHAEMMHLTLSVVAKTLFNHDVTGETDTVGKALTVALHEWNRSMSRPDMLNKLPIPPVRRYRQATAELDAIVYRIIAERRASGDDPGDLLSMLLSARDDDGSGMTDKQLRDEVMTLFLAGHETTANMLAWTWYLLTQNPAVAAKLRAELDEVLGGRLPTLEDLPRLPYTEMVITESMRLYPPAPGVGREALEDVEVGGYLIPKGMSLFAMSWVMHRDPRNFEEPLVFRPERWADGLAKRLPAFAYFPFGGGPRLCIGKSFALMEGALMLAAIAQRFAMRLAPGARVEPATAITLRPKYGMPMELHAR